MHLRPKRPAREGGMTDDPIARLHELAAVLVMLPAE